MCFYKSSNARCMYTYPAKGLLLPVVPAAWKTLLWSFPPVDSYSKVWLGDKMSPTAYDLSSLLSRHVREHNTTVDQVLKCLLVLFLLLNAPSNNAVLNFQCRLFFFFFCGFCKVFNSCFCFSFGSWSEFWHSTQRVLWAS